VPIRSLSKVDLRQESLNAIARRHLDSPDGVAGCTELADGYFNTAYRLDLPDGRRCGLKVAPPASTRVLRYEHDLLRVEVDVIQLVRQRTSLPAPAIWVYDPSGGIIANPFFIMEYLPGTPFDKLRRDWPEADQAAIDRAVGGFCRELAAIEGPAFGLYADPRHLTWRAAFGQLVDDILADGRDQAVALPYGDIRGRLAAHFDALDEVTTPRLVHWDLWDGNIFVDPAARVVTGVVDFERALWGDPLMEVCFRKMQPGSACMQGYGRDLLATLAQRRRRILYNLYLYLVIQVEHDYRQ
jgi:aminoglycoside phosphotransferase (APT) family kinase protein